jgi:hypothetical protein
MNKQAGFLLWVTDNFYVANGVPHLWYRKPVQSPAVPQGGLTAGQLEAEFKKHQLDQARKKYDEALAKVAKMIGNPIFKQSRGYQNMSWEIFRPKPDYNITCSTNDYQLLISINSIPHLCIRKSHLTGFQGYIKGEDAKVWYIEFYTKYGNFVSEYDNRDIWEQVLSCIGKAKIFKPQL